MERLPVDSSLIASMAHDDESNTLEVEFAKNGKVARYDNVPATLYIEMMQSDSVGRFFINNIKNNPEAYPYRYL